MELGTKDPNEKVTYSDLKEQHEALKKEFKSEFGEFKQKAEKYMGEDGELPADIEKQFDRLNDRLDEMEAEKNRLLNQYEAQKQDEEPSEAQKAYGEFLKRGGPGNPMRKGVDHETMGKLQDAKGLSTDSNVEGGYLVPENTRDQIISKRRATSPIREYATVLTISEGNQLKIPKEGSTDFDAGWTGERESRPETETADFEMLNIPTHEMYAKPLATQQMLDDSAFNIESWLESKVGEKFARKEGAAFVNGDGANKPEGILDTVPQSAKVPSGESTGITYGDSAADQGLLGLIYDIEIDEYVQNATLTMNRRTLGRIRGITDANNMPIWSPGMTETDPPNILGFEYFTATDMPTLDSNGNVAIVFGDLSMAYYIVDRQDIRFLRDPFSSKPHVEFYYTTRVGGQVVLEDALRYLVTGTSV